MENIKEKLEDMTLNGNDGKGDAVAARLLLELERQDEVDDLRKELFGV